VTNDFIRIDLHASVRPLSLVAYPLHLSHRIPRKIVEKVHTHDLVYDAPGRSPAEAIKMRLKQFCWPT
jgi:hypothetical protein